MPETTREHQSSIIYGRLSTARKNSLPNLAFPFPRIRREPMKNATPVRDADGELRSGKGRQ
jgi:hypothetical protein